MHLITVIAQDGTGRLAAVAETLGEAGINIEDITAEVRDDIGVINLVVGDEDAAIAALRAAGFAAVSRDALVLRIEDAPGALGRIAVRLGDAGISVRTMHIIGRDAGVGYASAVTDDNERAREILGDTVVSEL